MTGNQIAFRIHTKNQTTTERLSITRLVIAGWTGRDPVARDRQRRSTIPWPPAG
jgi:hypothetical protein